MMTSASESGKRRGGEDAESGKLLHEIEAISKALYLDSKNPNPKGKVHARSASIGGGRRSGFPEPKMTKSSTASLDNEERKKDNNSKSFWNWRKPLQALSHIRNKRFNCCFSLIVHSIEGLPDDMNYASLRVHWKRRDGEVATECAKVVDGMAEFDQRLTHTCSVYGSRSGPHHSAKYEAKHFLLYATLIGSPEVELGKHRIDLTRLLPLTLEELEEEKSYGRWTTNFKLSGKAKGAMMHVSFGYSVVKDNISPPPMNNKFAPGTISKQSNMSIARYGSRFSHNSAVPSLRRTGSLPSNPDRRPLALSRSVEDIKVMHEVSTTSSSETPVLIKIACRELDKDNLETSVVDKPETDVFTINVQPPDHSSLLSDTDTKIVHKESEKNETFVTQHGKELVEEPDEDVNIIEAVKILDASSREETGIYEKTEKNESFLPEYRKNSLGMDPAENFNSTDDVNTVDGSAREKARMEKETDKREICLPEKRTELLRWEPDNDLSRLDDMKVVPESATAEACVVKYGADPNVVPLEEPAELESLEEVFNDQLDCHLRLDDAIKGHSTCSKTVILQELQSALETVANLELAGIDSPEDESQTDDNFTGDYCNRKGKSISFDDETDLVAHEFLNLLQMEDSPIGFSSESESESPRERLLRQFEKDALADGFPLFDYSCFEEDQALPKAGLWGEANLDQERDDFELSSMILAAEEEYLVAIESEASKTKAQMLEDLETEDLMREWGLDKKVFDRSPSPSPRGFGVRDNLLDDPSEELPSLGEGLGPFIQTKNGGYIRSMNPSIFENSKSGGSLIMQVSNPVVVPAEMGSDVMEVLQGLASIGIEKLSMQASRLMPLEDITGKTMKQIAWEASPTMDATESRSVHQHEKAVTEHMSVEPRREERHSYKTRCGNVNTMLSDEGMRSEYVSLEDLAPLAMDKIEALSMEGLRIQAGMSDGDAPSNISAQSVGDISAPKGRDADLKGSLGMDGTAGLKLVDVRDSGEDVDGLMSLSLTLDEWMKLDSGDFDDNGDDQISERTCKILAAHHANSLELIRRGSRGDKRRGKGTAKKCGLLGNNFTAALLVQLRDPLRNYEPVGTPMLALIQVERVFLPGKPRIFSTVSQVGNSEEEDEGEAAAKAELVEPKEEKSREVEEGVAHYKITEVHVAGLKVDSAAKKKLWGSKTQQQSGSRWLAANGMGKPDKHPLLKSKPAAPAAPRDSLWSISSLFWGRGARSQEPSGSSSLKRNANIVL